MGKGRYAPSSKKRIKRPRSLPHSPKTKKKLQSGAFKKQSYNPIEGEKSSVYSVKLPKIQFNRAFMLNAKTHYCMPHERLVVSCGVVLVILSFLISLIFDFLTCSFLHYKHKLLLVSIEFESH